MDYDTDRPIVGFRKFRVPTYPTTDYGLSGAWSMEPWPAGEPMVAGCHTHRTDPEECVGGVLNQHPNCKCGLHIWFTITDCIHHATMGSPYVVAVTAGGGRVLFDEKYARCEIAEILCLVDPWETREQFRRDLGQKVPVTQLRPSGTKFTTWDFPRINITEDVYDWALQAADHYGIPLLGTWEAMGLAEEHGSFVWELKDQPDGSVLIEGVD